METQAEDEQAFLARQQQSLQAGVPAGVRQESPMRAPPSVTKTVDRRSVGAPSVQIQLASPKKVTHVPDIFAPLHSNASPLLSGSGIHITSIWCWNNGLTTRHQMVFSPKPNSSHEKYGCLSFVFLSNY